jgi:hypothetical protein
MAWEPEVWIAAMPDHMIHFNGPKFLGPYRGMERGRGNGTGTGMERGRGMERGGGLLPISWSSDNGSHVFVDSVDEGSGRSSSIGTYLSQVAANSAGVL